NAQEKRQLELIGKYLKSKGYKQKQHPSTKPLTEMEPGTFAFRMNVMVGKVNKVKIPIDVVLQRKKLRPTRLPILIEAKSAGDFTNVNKRRKEEAKKMSQLKATFGMKSSSSCSCAVTSTRATWGTRRPMAWIGSGNTGLRTWTFSGCNHAPSGRYRGPAI